MVVEVSADDFDAKPSQFLGRVKAGEEIVICRAGKPIARLVRYESNADRKPGQDEGRIWISDDFDAPLPSW